MRTKPNRGPLTTQGGRESIGTSSQLAQLASATEGPPFEKWAHYFEIYDEVLGEVARQSREGARHKPLRVLEIGVWRGGSLKLWRDYFGKHAVIYGIDVDPECAHLGVSDAEVRIGSQADLAFVRSVVKEMGGVDVVIDDGSHVSKHVIASLSAIFPLLAEGGLYIIEDLATSYWPEFGGGLRRTGTSIEFLKHLVDVLHQPYFDARAVSEGSPFTHESLHSVQFFDSMTVLRKAKSGPPVRLLLGGGG